MQSLVTGAAAWLGGALIAMSADGKVAGYGAVGLLAMGATLAAMAWAGRLRMHGERRQG